MIVGLIQKNQNGDCDIPFSKRNLDFLGLSLYPWNIWRNQIFLYPWNFYKIALHPLEILRSRTKTHEN